MYDTIQMPDEITHVFGLNEPPMFPSFHDIIPVGMVGEIDVSMTLTVNDTEAP